MTECNYTSTEVLGWLEQSCSQDGDDQSSVNHCHELVTQVLKWFDYSTATCVQKEVFQHFLNANVDGWGKLVELSLLHGTPWGCSHLQDDRVRETIVGVCKDNEPLLKYMVQLLGEVCRILAYKFSKIETNDYTTIMADTTETIKNAVQDDSLVEAWLATKAACKEGIKDTCKAATKAGINDGTRAAAKEGTNAAAKAAVKAGGTEAAAKTAVKASVKAGTKAAIEAYAKGGTKAATKAAIKASAGAGTKAAAMSGSKAATKAAVKAGIKAGTKAAVKAGTKAGSKVAKKAGTEAANKAGKMAATKTIGTLATPVGDIAHAAQTRLQLAGYEEAGQAVGATGEVTSKAMAEFALEESVGDIVKGAAGYALCAAGEKLRGNMEPSTKS